MADRIIERTTEKKTEAPRDTVVVERDDRPRERGSNTGLIIAVIILVVLLLLIFGHGIFSGGGGSSGGTSGGSSTSSGQ